MRFYPDDILRKPPEDGGFLLSELPERDCGAGASGKELYHRDIGRGTARYWLKPEKRPNSILISALDGLPLPISSIVTVRMNLRLLMCTSIGGALRLDSSFRTCGDGFSGRLPKRWIERSLQISGHAAETLEAASVVGENFL